MSDNSIASTLLERQQELVDLRRGIDAGRCGAGSVMVVEGPAGIGKSRRWRPTSRVGLRWRMSPVIVRSRSVRPLGAMITGATSAAGGVIRPTIDGGGSSGVIEMAQVAVVISRYIKSVIGRTGGAR